MKRIVHLLRVQTDMKDAVAGNAFHFTGFVTRSVTARRVLMKPISTVPLEVARSANLGVPQVRDYKFRIFVLDLESFRIF